MKRIAAALALGSMLAVTAHGAGAQTQTGGAYVTTLPSGADIWIDGTYVGRAPVLIGALLPGHHAVTLTKTGWIVREVDVVVAPGAVALSSTELAAGPRAMAGAASGSAIVRSAPAASVLELDGAAGRAGIGRPVSLPAGTHHLTMTTAHGKMTIAFVVLPDTTTDLVLAEPHAKDQPSAVVAPADDYLPDGSVTVTGKRIVIRMGNHLAICHFGDTAARLDGANIVLDSMPESIADRVYLPLTFLQTLTAATAKAP